MTVYLDCNATTPIEPEVRDAMWPFFTVEYGNAGSRTHEYGSRAQHAVEHARHQIAEVVGAERADVIFTSGATESNNLATLGLADHGERSGRKHIVATAIEHKAVLEPLAHLESRGFELTLLNPGLNGAIDAGKVKTALREDTLLVSVIHVNNETGVVQPLEDIAKILEGHSAFFHTDAAQGFGKISGALRNPRLDLISISGHKIYGPKGVGALILRKRGYRRPPIKPLLFGGGQERGLRPGTLPVPLIVGLGKAAELALRDHQKRATQCQRFRDRVIVALGQLEHEVNGDPNLMLPHVINLSLNGLDSEAVMVALKNTIAISNGSACTSRSYEPSHVLRAMGLSKTRVAGALRISWSHLTEPVGWDSVIAAIKNLL